MKKRIISLLLVAAMAVGMMVGCGKKEEPAPTPSTKQEEQKDTAADASSVVEEVDYDSLPTLNVLFTHAYQYEGDDNVVWKEVAKRIGAKVHFITADTDKRNAMIASGEGYDILASFNADMKAQAEGGGLLPLDDLITDEVKEAMGLYIETSKKNYSHDGKLYWLPYGASLTNGNVGDKDAGRNMFRWDLYAEIGYPEVKTYMDLPDVLADMLEKFPTNEAGETAYACALPAESGPMANAIFALGGNAQNQEPAGIGSVRAYKCDDMSFVSQYDPEEGAFWYGIQFFNKCWNMGIMDPDSFAMAEADMKAKNDAGRLYHAHFSWNYSSGAPYMAVPFTQDTIYTKVVNNKAVGLDATGYGQAINAKTKLKDQAVAYMNLIHTVEGCNLIFNGIEGVHWEYDANGVRQYTDYAWDLWNTENNEAWHKEGLWHSESANMIGIGHSTILDDGKTMLLHKDKTLFESSLTDIQKEFCEHYGVSYPTEAYAKIMEDNGVTGPQVQDPFVAAFLPSNATAPDDIRQIEGNIAIEAESWISKLVKCPTEDFEDMKADCLAALEKAGLSKAEQYYKDNWQAAFDEAAKYK